MLLSKIIESYFQENVTMQYVLSILFVLVVIVCAYVLGSINSFKVVGRFVFKKNLIKGKSNRPEFIEVGDMFLVLRWKGVIFGVIFEFIKTSCAVWIGTLLFYNVFLGGAIAAFFTMFGQMFPIFNRLRGGKGILTLICAVFWLEPMSCLFLIFAFFVIAIGTKFISLASVMTGMLYPIILKVILNIFYKNTAGGLYIILGVLTTVFVIFTNYKNLKKIWNNVEPKTNLLDWFKKTKKDTFEENNDDGNTK